ncbi:MAG: MBL fold metallo-hydrolase [Porphyromonas sp.]|nr:MBL fold metallo-hydrolase [Porphyromonas sp.]
MVDRITFLGTGTSTGIPEIACDCEVCTSPDQRDKRYRTSALVEYCGKKVLIDCGPDFRCQMVENRVMDIDAIIITHEHYDHTGGLDDLRPLFYRSHECPIYAEEHVVEAIKLRLPYAFREPRYPGVPYLEMRTIQAGYPIDLGDGVEILPFTVMHGKLPILGFKFGGLAYITDCKTLPRETKELLKGVDLLVINALRHYDHAAHLTFEEGIEIIDELKPRQAYLVHFAHTIGRHEEIEKICPPGVAPAYDGLTVNF